MHWLGIMWIMPVACLVMMVVMMMVVAGAGGMRFMSCMRGMARKRPASDRSEIGRD